MKTSALTIRTYLILTATLLLVVLGGLNLRDRIQTQPNPDDGVTWVNGRRGITASYVRPGSPASIAEIRKGYVLRAIVSPATPGDGVFWEDTNDGIRAKQVVPGGPGAEAGIVEGQILLGISRSSNGVADPGFDAVKKATEVGFYLDRAGLGEQLTYKMIDPGDRTPFAVDVKTASTYRPIFEPSDVPRL